MESCSEAHHFAYIEVSRKASSVIFKAKSKTWQALQQPLTLLNSPCCVQPRVFPNFQSPKDIANAYAVLPCCCFSHSTS